MADTNKTEKATPKKKQDEYKKGNIFQSKDLAGAVTILGIFFFLRMIGSFMFGYITKTLTESISSFSDIQELDILSASKYIGKFAIDSMILILPVGFVSILLPVVITAGQTKLMFSSEQLKPKFSRLNPITGFKNMFSIRSAVGLIKSIILIIIIAVLLYNEISGKITAVMKIINISVAQSLVFICNAVYDIVVDTALCMIAIGILDYFYQWWEYERSMRMTKQEVKDEYKQIEGDPELKGKIKERQRRLSVMRMMDKVPMADVVIKNPTHYAVALVYKPEDHRAPVVVAKGADYLALKIIEVAEKNNVVVKENRVLARGLYESVEINDEIPEEFYKAVADILAYIYNIKKGTLK